MTTDALVAPKQKAVGEIEIARIAGDIGRTTQHRRSEKHVLNTIIGIQHLRHAILTRSGEAVRSPYQQLLRTGNMQQLGCPVDASVVCSAIRRVKHRIRIGQVRRNDSGNLIRGIGILVIQLRQLQPGSERHALRVHNWTLQLVPVTRGEYARLVKRVLSDGVCHDRQRF